MKRTRLLRIISNIFVFAPFFLFILVEVTHGQNYPVPLDRIKEVVVTQGKKDNGGSFLWKKEIEDVAYWMVYCPSDGSVAFGKGMGSGFYSWGIAYGLKGEFQFLEAIRGLVITFLVIEAENAIEIADQFFKELETLIGNPLDCPTEGKWIEV